ncbi:MAG TPA: hypothetical protein PLX85_09615, partial [Dehalococcoidia bacterium]|nr:hypothetical protein [Dehalococcoidia bacterium]
ALDAPALHWPELGTTDAPALLRIALRDLLALGLIRRTQTDVRDVSEGYRGPRGKLPQFSTPPVPAEPVAAKPVAPKPTPIAPLPTPSGTGHGASTPTPAEPAPVVARPVTVEKPVVTEKPTVAPAPAPKPAPVAAPVSDPSGPVIADHLGQLTALLAAVVSQGRLDPSRETVEHRSRLALARRVAVLLAAHGPLTRSDLTRMKLSTIQKDALTDAIEYALAVGAIKGGERRRFVLADATLLGLDRATVQTEVELIHQRAAERAAREANKATQAALERVTA